VLITGGSGFIGANLCDRLLASGAKVHATSRELRSSANTNLRWWLADLTDVSSIRQVFNAVQPQIVFHLASHVVGSRELNAVLPTFHANLASTVQVLTAAAEAGCERIVLAGSSEEPLTTDEATFPCSPYAAAKWSSSMYGRMFHQLFSTPVVMPRIFMTYGPNQKDLGKLVPSVICQLLRGEVPKLGSGRRLADWIYVDDVVEGLIRSAVVPGIEGCAFDLGSGSLISVREIVEQVAEIIGGNIAPAFGALPDRPFEQERAADVGFVSARLGLQLMTSLRQGLASTVDWYRHRVATGLPETSRSW
jgi:UDP-glucose 4-epimerase